MATTWRNLRSSTREGGYKQKTAVCFHLPEMSRKANLDKVKVDYWEVGLGMQKGCSGVSR